MHSVDSAKVTWKEVDNCREIHKGSYLFSGIWVLIGSLVISGTFYFMRLSGPDWAILLLLASLAAFWLLVGSILANGIARRNIDWTEPIYLVLVAYSLHYAVRTIQMATTRWGPTFPNLSLLDTGTIAVAQFYGFLGLFAMATGYFTYNPVRLIAKFPIPRWLDAPALNANSLNRTALIFGVGVIIQSFSIFSNRYVGFVNAVTREQAGTILGILGVLEELPLFAYVIVLCETFIHPRRVSKRRMFLLSLMLLWNLFMAMLSGTKGDLIGIVLISTIAWYRTRGAIEWRALSVFIMVVIFGVFPYVSAYRATYWEVNTKYGGQLTLESLATHAQRIAEELNYSETGLMGPIMNFVERMYGIEALSVAVKYSSVYGFHYGRSYVAALLRVVPRAVFPWKPAPYSMDFEERYIGRNPLDPTVIQVPQLVEAYLNFGLPGIILVMLLLGMLYKCIHLYFRAHNSPFAIGPYGYILIKIIMVEHPIDTIYGGLLKTVILFAMTASWVAVNCSNHASDLNHATRI